MCLAATSPPLDRVCPSLRLGADGRASAVATKLQFLEWDREMQVAARGRYELPDFAFLHDFAVR